MSNTDGEDTQRIEVPTWYTENEMHQWLLRNNYSENIAKELSGMYANYLQGSFKVGFEKGQRSQEQELASLREQLKQQEEVIEGFKEQLAYYEHAAEQHVNNLQKIGEKEEVIRELTSSLTYIVETLGTLSTQQDELEALAYYEALRAIQKAKSLTTKDK